MAVLKNLSDLLADQLKDLYSAEKQLVKALPKIAKAANHPALKKAILNHLEQTKNHVTRLETAAKELEIKLGGKHCNAMEGLIEEGGEAAQEQGDEAVCDAVIIAAAQRVEHYEIAAYGTARAIARQMKNSNLVKLLTETLDEEKAANEGLTDICVKDLYPTVSVE